MKTMLLRFTFTGLLAMLAVPLTYAQTKIIADIPFDFTVGSKTMEGGKCEAGTINWATVVVRCRGHQDTSFATSIAATALKVPEESKLVFRRYDDRFFLAQVWVAGQGAGRELPRTAMERRLVQTAATRSIVVIVAKR